MTLIELIWLKVSTNLSLGITLQSLQWQILQCRYDSKLRLYCCKYKQFYSKWDSRIIIYDRRVFIRLSPYFCLNCDLILWGDWVKREHFRVAMSPKTFLQCLLCTDTRPVWPDWAIFVKNLVTNFTSKVAQIFCGLGGYFEKQHLLSINKRGCFLGYISDRLGSCSFQHLVTLHAMTM